MAEVEIPYLFHSFVSFPHPSIHIYLIFLLNIKYYLITMWHMVSNPI
ncbi:Uncharacterized protein APZ42_025201 [Daphnia magna]|uniref:Uncharacterized protein n=1 Tax=Daphnia magna TaxID=35525 RepID=A0A164TDF5_9CRUS|nr:Uncharacterized protein APZ42_025201 [Daphnia magna]